MTASSFIQREKVHQTQPRFKIVSWSQPDRSECPWVAVAASRRPRTETRLSLFPDSRLELIGQIYSHNYMFSPYILGCCDFHRSLKGIGSFSLMMKMLFQ